MSLDKQVGGQHYKGGMQPLEFFDKNPQLNWQQQNIIKYAYRHPEKNREGDLLKVIHYALIECALKYPDALDNLKDDVRELL
ncbi:DUF3310 domain-containing protein [Salmonella enterica]|nr:DUF3310 domain-containing protein [Salmonella enterica]EAO0118578.1 DUF3310 domain-containing protein [Salmonella enterica]EAO3601681.1 DUF3310 domain-containing protein [Salmonella enterica]EAR6391576.1 DUF3310 domain-containing protein [Salmonella enterica]EAV1285340.1 DUF3310 domain-containing protein [Salmonella enterica]